MPTSKVVRSTQVILPQPTAKSPQETKDSSLSGASMGPREGLSVAARITRIMQALDEFGSSMLPAPKLTKEFGVSQIQSYSDLLSFNINLDGVRLHITLQERAIRDPSTPLPKLGLLEIEDPAWIGGRSFSFDRSDEAVLKKAIKNIERITSGDYGWSLKTP